MVAGCNLQLHPNILANLQLQKTKKTARKAVQRPIIHTKKNLNTAKKKANKFQKHRAF